MVVAIGVGDGMMKSGMMAETWGLEAVASLAMLPPAMAGMEERTIGERD